MVVAAALALLAALDITGSLAAKEAVIRRSPPIAVAGALLFLAMFYVFASVLAADADLAVVTLGWCVLVQVGVLLLDRFRYQVHLSTGQWVAVAVVLAAQGYLLWPADQPTSSTTANALASSRPVRPLALVGAHPSRPDAAEARSSVRRLPPAPREPIEKVKWP